MKTYLLVIALSVLSLNSFAQQSETDAIKKTVNTLFEAMRKGDTVLLKSIFAKDMVLHSVVDKPEGTVLLANNRAQGFVTAVGTPHKEVWDERVTYKDIKIDGNLASVWAPYKFYLGTQFSHCGVDIIQLMKTKEGWKIIYLVDNTRKDNCPD